MSEIATYESRAEIVAQPDRQEPSRASSELVAWAQEMQIAADIASKLALTSFVPQSLRGKPADLAAAILAGLELGLQPMATLRSIDVIQGTPALRAHAMRGLLQSHGHQIELVESTPVLCVMRGRRKGAEEWQTVMWPIARAAQMGLVKKAEWTKQPQTMLVARATGELSRLIASDALFAMPYTAEELRVSDEIIQAAQGTDGRMTLAEIMGAPAAAAPVPVPEVPVAGPVEDPRRPDLHLWTEEQIAEAFPGAIRRGPELIVPRSSAQQPAEAPSWDGVEYPPEEEFPAGTAPSEPAV